ncbi:MAG: hypothetical protein QF565_13145 [Arenicellales bacterium]|jgi:hypothetical protein|nr:hypothetical protein [Arenicellales bacterium]
MTDAITVIVDFKTLAGERSHDVRPKRVVQIQKQRCRRRTPVTQRPNQQIATNSVINNLPPSDTLPPKSTLQKVTAQKRFP